MERLRRGEHHVVRPDLQHLRAIGIGRRAQAAMHMAHALGRAGRAGRIEPERHLIGRRIDGRRGRIAAGKECVEPDLSAHHRPAPPVAAIRLRNDDAAQFRHAVQHRQQGRDQRRRDHQRLGTAVGQDVADHLVRQQRVDRHRHDAGADRPPERDGEIDGVQHQQHHALLARDAGRTQRAGKAARGFGQCRHSSASATDRGTSATRRGPRSHGDRRNTRPRCPCLQAFTTSCARS